MSSIASIMDRVAAAKKTTPTSSIRKILFPQSAEQAAYVSVAVPVGAREGSFPTPNGDAKYLQFARNVKGGVVNIFVHGDGINQFRGEQIIAEAQVMEKTLQDGRVFIYIDLLPQREDVKATHKLVVMSAADVIAAPERSVSFMTPRPMEGVVILAPLDEAGQAKIVAR
jgi:hypothetical protein